jgi:hypothetical protein
MILFPPVKYFLSAIGKPVCRSQKAVSFAPAAARRPGLPMGTPAFPGAGVHAGNSRAFDRRPVGESTRILFNNGANPLMSKKP